MPISHAHAVGWSAGPVNDTSPDYVVDTRGSHWAECASAGLSMVACSPVRDGPASCDCWPTVAPIQMEGDPAKLQVWSPDQSLPTCMPSGVFTVDRSSEEPDPAEPMSTVDWFPMDPAPAWQWPFTVALPWKGSERLHLDPANERLHLDSASERLHLDPASGRLHLDPVSKRLHLEAPPGPCE